MRAIPIRAAATAAECDTESGEVRRIDRPLVRREFLKGTGVLIGYIAGGTALAALAPSPVWALELKALNEREGQTLMAMGRVLFPHEKLPDAVYALLAKDLDAKAAADAAMAKRLRAGIAALHKNAGGDFLTATPASRLDIVKQMAGEPFFATVRGQCITSLYDNDMAYATFGYPGASWDKGGYITRGFQDLQWLPAPPLEASPKPWMG